MSRSLVHIVRFVAHEDRVLRVSFVSGSHETDVHIMFVYTFSPSALDSAACICLQVCCFGMVDNIWLIDKDNIGIYFKKEQHK